MKKLITLFCILFLSISAFSQQNKKFEEQWAKQIVRLGKPSQALYKADKQNNTYILADYDTLKYQTLNLSSPVSYASSVLMKLDSSGKLLWSFPMNDAARRLNSLDLLVDDNGNSFITGEYIGPMQITSTTTLDSNQYAGITNIYFAKINGSGQLQWAKAIKEGGKASLFNAGNGLIGFKRDQSNSNYQIGDTQSGAELTYGMALYDANGNVKATKILPYWNGYTNPWTFTSDNNGNIYALMQLLSDSLIFDGTVARKNTGSYANFVIAKLDKNLDLIWLKNWENVLSKNVSFNINNRELATDAAGNLYITALFTDKLMVDGKDITAPNTSGRLFIAKLNPQGTVEWLHGSNTTGGSESIRMLGIKNDRLYLLGSNSFGSITFDNLPKVSGPAVVSVDLASGNALNANAWPIVQYGSGNYTIGGSAHYALANLYSSDNYVIKGISYPPIGKNDLLLIKLDSTSTTSIAKANYSRPQFSIYPNPASKIVTVAYSGNAQAVGNICVTDITGKILYSQKVNLPQNSIDVSGFANGMYFINFTDAKGNYSSQKLLIQK